MHESRHTWMSHVTHEWVTSHMNESRHTWMSYVTHGRFASHMNASWHIPHVRMYRLGDTKSAGVLEPLWAKTCVYSEFLSLLSQVTSHVSHEWRVMSHTIELSHKWIRHVTYDMGPEVSSRHTWIWAKMWMWMWMYSEFLTNESFSICMSTDESFDIWMSHVTH